MDALHIPFVSEAYDRLVKAQLAFVKPSLIDAVDDGKKLRAARDELGLTQAALASRLGLTAPAISNMESGADRINARVDLSVRYLLVEHRA